MAVKTRDPGPNGYYNSEDPPPEGGQPEAEEDKTGFYSGYVPAAQGCITGGKVAIEKGDYAWADQCLKSADDWLNRAKQDTLERIQERDKKSS